MRLIDIDMVKKSIDRDRPGRCYEDAWCLTVLEHTPTVKAIPIDVLQEILQEIKGAEWFQKDAIKIIEGYIEEYTE